MAKMTTTTIAQATPAGDRAYIVTNKAPPKVAGQRVQEGDHLTLTEDQARFEEIAGHIVKAPAEAGSTAE